MARQEGDNVDAEVEEEAIIEAEPQIEATVDATVSEVGATAKRTPPPILVLEDGETILLEFFSHVATQHHHVGHSTSCWPRFTNLIQCGGYEVNRGDGHVTVSRQERKLLVVG